MEKRRRRENRKIQIIVDKNMKIEGIERLEGRKKNKKTVKQKEVNI